MTTDERFDRIDAAFGRIDAAIERMSQSTSERFDRMDERFDRMDERLNRMDARFDRMDERFDRMDERFDRIDERFERVDASVERLSEHTTIRFEALTNYIGEFRVEAITRLDMMDSRIGLIVTTLASIDPNSRLPTLTKGVMDLGGAVSKFGIELWKQKDDFGNRLTKLEETVAKLHNPAA